MVTICDVLEMRSPVEQSAVAEWGDLVPAGIHDASTMRTFRGKALVPC